MIENHKCTISVYLAYAMISYIFASVYYLAMTRGIGTPFNISLTEDQKKIKKQESEKRKNIFFQGLILSIIFLMILNPFKKCTSTSK